MQEGYIRRLDNVIHPSVHFGKDVVLGFGVIIEEGVWIGNDVLIDHYCIIRPKVEIGDQVELRPYCFIAENAIIGAKTHIFQYSNICKNAVVGPEVYMGAKVMLVNTRNIAHQRPYPTILEGPFIGYGARLGSGSIITPGVRIGSNAFVAAGSVVTKDVPDNMIAAGNPARAIREVPFEERI